MNTLDRLKLSSGRQIHLVTTANGINNKQEEMPRAQKICNLEDGRGY